MIVGGGIVGLSTAWQLRQRLPNRDIVVLEKEQELARHQSSHNSGVIHAGIYYAPGSLKARLCRAGRLATVEFCEQRNIPVLRCGKLIVALDEGERVRLDALAERARANQVDVTRLSASELRARVPGIAGVAALWSPGTAAVDFKRIAIAMAELFQANGGRVVAGARVETWHNRDQLIELGTSAGTIEGRFVVCCAGLYADRLARLAGLKPDFRIVPFRGEFYRLPPSFAAGIAHHVYPAPDPSLPFLGVHVTRTVEGGVMVGPNAVLALHREGYRRSDFDAREVAALLASGGLWRLALRHWRTGVGELHTSLSQRAYARAVRRYFPDLTADLLEEAPAGVRAQAVSSAGRLLDDFKILETPRSLHVCNAPSPAATSAIPIGDYLAELTVGRISQSSV